MICFCNSRVIKRTPCILSSTTRCYSWWLLAIIVGMLVTFDEVVAQQRFVWLPAVVVIPPSKLVTCHEDAAIRLSTTLSLFDRQKTWVSLNSFCLHGTSSIQFKTVLSARYIYIYIYIYQFNSIQPNLIQVKFQIQNSKCKFQFSNFKFQISNSKSKKFKIQNSTSKFKIQHSTFKVQVRIQISKFKIQNAKCNTQIQTNSVQLSPIQPHAVQFHSTQFVCCYLRFLPKKRVM